VRLLDRSIALSQVQTLWFDDSGTCPIQPDFFVTTLVSRTAPQPRML